VVNHVKELSLPEVRVELVHPLVPLSGCVVVQMHSHVGKLEPGKAPLLLHFHLLLLLHHLQILGEVNKPNLEDVLSQRLCCLLLPALVHRG